jgi:nucleotide-binding universal stress UspA family protein
MFTHLLVAIDFTPAWEQLLARLMHLHSWGNRRVTLVYVLGTRYPTAPELRHREHYEARLAGIAHDLEAAGFEVDWQIRTGEIAPEILAAARETGATALLAGTRAHNLLQKWFFGSTALNLARLTDRPLWLEPILARPAVKAVHTVLLATDGSTHVRTAEAAFWQIRALVERGLVVMVSEAGSAPPADALHHVLEGVHTEIYAGDPREGVIDFARDAEVDLIILGKRGETAMPSLLLGSTAENVCRRAGRPVLLIP